MCKSLLVFSDPVPDVASHRCRCVGSGQAAHLGPAVSSRGLHRQPLLQHLMEALDLFLGLRVIRGVILLGDPEPLQLILESVTSSFSAGETSRIDHAVNGQR